MFLGLHAQVDIIAIDFSEKLPFRLKQPMVKAAIKVDPLLHYLCLWSRISSFGVSLHFGVQRGVYFEITYSGLLGDAQSRRLMISNSKVSL